MTKRSAPHTRVRRIDLAKRIESQGGSRGRAKRTRPRMAIGVLLDQINLYFVC